MKKAWGGRFAAETDARAEKFTASIGFDKRLFREDIEGSKAHAMMLGRSGIISPEEAAQIVQGLDEIKQEISDGTFVPDASAEDIHLNIEQRLIAKIGKTGAKLHTARSRNDQIALDEHLFVLSAVLEIRKAILALREVLVNRAEENLGVIMPGYTHLQRAQPVLLSHHLMAYFHMLTRDDERFKEAGRRADMSPLGAAALAGTTYPIDRSWVATKLGLSRVYENSMDAVSDRDFIMEFLAAASICMIHLSRLGEELVLWSSEEFGFVEMDDSFATGSSIMPQKKNPDVAELIRGKSGRVIGDLVSLLVTMKGLPLAYHSDMQEDKERLFDGFDTLRACLQVAAGMLQTLKFKPERMKEALKRDYSNATEVADYLVSRGMPFREAHEVTGKMVRYCLEKRMPIGDLSLDELRRFSPLFDDDIYGLLTPEACVARRNTLGGTAPEQVREQIRTAKELLSQTRSELLQDV
ncbi:MAG TPA: argininosuccinate lyase [Firmicutes bacterium]|nr:argininosuccinate lyase [Bacillota bacterium]